MPPQAIDLRTNQYELRAEFAMGLNDNVDFALYARPLAEPDRRSSVANVNGILGDLMDALEIGMDEEGNFDENTRFEESDWLLSPCEATLVSERITTWWVECLELTPPGRRHWIDDALDEDRSVGEWEFRGE